MIEAATPATEHARTGPAAFVIGGGETGALIRSIDWDATPLGAATRRPYSLRTAINRCAGTLAPEDVTRVLHKPLPFDRLLSVVRELCAA